jgi:hypothetical protein
MFLGLELNDAQVASHKVIVVTERIRKGVDRYLDPSDVEMGRSRAVVGIGGLDSVAKKMKIPGAIDRLKWKESEMFLSTRYDRVVCVKARRAAEDGEWGVVPVSFTTFGWLGADSGLWRAGSSQRQRDGSGWTCAAGSWRRKSNGHKRTTTLHWAANLEREKKGWRRRVESDDGNKTSL